jgi:enediyne biosynthesis protein E4
LNDGKVNFTDATKKMAEGLGSIGMVTDAVWMDVNADKQDDLIVVGEWMPIKIFVNNNGTLSDKSETYVPPHTEGWWNCIFLQDLDQDGRMDFLVGNYGNNNQFKPTENKPVSIFYDDFDKNGSVDPIMNYFIGNDNVPSPTRDELVDQVPMFKKRFPSYTRYAQSTIDSILTKEQVDDSKKLIAYHFESAAFMNTTHGFVMKALPKEAQFSPVYAIQAIDVNNDGRPDLVLGGNQTMVSARFGKASGNFGTVLLNIGKGDFKTIAPVESGLCVRPDIRKMAMVNGDLVIATNNDKVKVFSPQVKSVQRTSTQQ